MGAHRTEHAETIMQMLRDGHTTTEICRATGVTRDTVGRYRAELRSGAPRTKRDSSPWRAVFSSDWAAAVNRLRTYAGKEPLKEE